MTRTAPELHPNLVLDPRVQPIARRIVDAVLRAVQDGSLVDDDPLPSTRRMAEVHGFARCTVVEAYETLCGLGVCHAVHGSGTRVAPGAQELLTGQPEPRTALPGTSQPPRLPAVNMTVPAGVGTSVISPRDWNRAWREATSPEAMDTGCDLLHTALVDHLRSFRGVALDPKRLVLRPSLGSAVADIVHGLELRGSSVAIEDPSFPRIQRHFLNEGCRVHCIPVDEQGLRIDLLSPDDRCIHVTPARQWPTGVAMGPERREALLGWSHRTGGVIIENDLDAEFTYGHAPSPTLFSMAAASGRARVIYLGSSAKLVTPELGIVWLVVDRAFRRRAQDVAPVSEFPARALAHYLRSGAWYRHRNRALAIFEERREAMLEALRTRAPGVVTSGDSSGTELVIRLPSGVDEFIVQMRLEDAGFHVSSVGDFAVRRHQQALVVRYGDITPMQARQFASALKQVLSEVCPD